MDFTPSVVVVGPRKLLDFRNVGVAPRHIVCLAVCLGLADVPLSAQTYFEVVRSLNFQQNHFQQNRSTLMQAADGNFYLTTSGGWTGYLFTGWTGWGSILRMTPSGSTTVLHDFTGGPDGGFPGGALIQATDGNFYGTTMRGGSAVCPQGCGTVFRMTPDGAITVLHAFTGNDGSLPNAALIQASDGDFYGTTLYGGTPADYGHPGLGGGGGTVFRITPDGSHTILHVLTFSDLAVVPAATLIQATDGNFYGVTETGGLDGSGVIFRITPTGGFTILHRFAGGRTRAVALATLLQASDGNFYGTTFEGVDGVGTIFKMTPSGAFTTLHALRGGIDGLYSSGSLIEKDGAFYGTMAQGTPSDGGAVFSITPDGTFTLQYVFRDGADGASPASLIRGLDGAFYGVTTGGGAFKLGTVFRLGSRPPANRSFAADFDGDGKSDLVVYRPDTGTWFVRYSSSGYSYAAAKTYQWGLPGDLPLAADFDGDGKTDLVVWRPDTGTWFVRYSSNGYSYATATTYQWGLPGDVPLAADFDGDGRTDLVVYRPDEGKWFVRYSSTGYSYATARVFYWGLPGDIPQVADVDGDHKTDLVVYRPGNGAWYVRTSSSGYAYSASYQFGGENDAPLAMDLDGDGKTDLAVWRPANGFWYVLYSSSHYTSWVAFQWGVDGDMPLVSDFDGDHRADLVVWRPSTGAWYLRYSSAGFSYGRANVFQWGLTGDDPI
jgi:uncharacterized repeat protein (TIGR03803 family)